VTPLYVSSTSNPIPEIKEIVAAYGTNIAISPTIAGDLQQIFGVVPNGAEGSQKIASSVPNTVVSSQASSIISKAQSLYKKAQIALKSGNLSLYQQDINQIGSLLNQISTKVTSSSVKK